MRCPHCNHPEDHVIDSRPNETSNVIRRRRECMSCSKRFTTYERCETMPLIVIKSDNRREPFDRTKIRQGVTLACKKREISADQIEKLITEVELELQEQFVLEAPSERIGNIIMEKLRGLDPVAYIRFASVYRQFSDLDSFSKELEGLKKEKKVKKKKSSSHNPALAGSFASYSEN